MHSAQRNLIWSSTLLLLAILGCHEAGPVAERSLQKSGQKSTGKVIERTAEQQASKMAKGLADKAMKETVTESMRRAALDGDQAAREEFENLSQEQPTFRDYLKKFGEGEKERLRDCIIKELLYGVAPDRLKQTKIIEACFPEPVPSP
jgi:hypothetical protein